MDAHKPLRGAIRTLVPLMIIVLFALSACSSARVTPESDGPDVKLSIKGGQTVGPAELRVVLTEDGSPVEGASVRVIGEMSHAGMQPVMADALSRGEGEYLTSGFEFSMAGDWVLTVSGIMPDGLRFERTFTVEGVTGGSTPDDADDEEIVDGVTIIDLEEDEPTDEQAPSEEEFTDGTYVLEHLDADSLEIPPGDPIPTIDLIIEERGGVWEAHIMTDMTFVDSRAASYSPGQGHAHVYVDGDFQSIVYQPTFSLTGISAGDHIITVALSAADLREFVSSGQPIRDTKTVTIAQEIEIIDS